MNKFDAYYRYLKELKNSTKSNRGTKVEIDNLKKLINDSNCEIKKKKKNWYCKLNNICITVNAYSFTIITAHIIK